MPLSIKNFRLLRRLGVFVDHNHAVEIPDFRQFNLIYGFNGSGKTTLSRVLRSLETGTPSPRLASDGEFTIAFNDGPDTKHDGLNGTPHDKLVVFNCDFVEENLRWQEGVANPVFFIGKEQARLSLLVERLTKRLETRDQRRQQVDTEKRQADTELRTFKTDTARLIAEELNLGRRYNATHLDTDYAQLDLSKFSLLSDNDRQAKKLLINRSTPGNAVVTIASLSVDLVGYLTRVRDICGESFAAAVIAELKQHAEMLKWAKDGLDYHATHTLDRCLFCGNDFSEARAEALRQSIDDRFERTVDAVQRLQSERATQFDVLDKFKQGLPAVSDLDASLTDRYSANRTKLVDAIDALHAILTQARTPLDIKARTPNLAIDVSAVDVERARTLAETVDILIADANAIIGQHNDKISRFEQEKEEAKIELKAHHLLEAQTEYNSLSTGLAATEKEVEVRTRLHQRLRTYIEKARQQLRSHGLAVEPINKLLASYLGHGDLTLTTLEEGYQIQRKGEPIDGPLSEGEKTALAICYFLSKLEENGRKLEETIVVIDDPISSLDTKALNYAFNLLKLVLGKAAQVIFLTHNLQFMNETKRWLKPLAREGDKPPTATLLFLEVKLADGNIRTAMIKPLPRLLRDYDSEYHYLCQLIFLFVNAEADNTHLGYILPNVLRKVLELFLAFKMPGPEGLGSKLKHEYVRNCGIGEARVDALHRLADAESHGDNLDDLIGLSSMTVEETRDAAKSLLELMEKLDAQHFERMKRLCR